MIAPQRRDAAYSLVTLDTTVVQSIVVDTFSITATSPELIETLRALRHEVMLANNKTAIFFSVVAMPLSEKAALVRAHNDFMTLKFGIIQELCDQAMELLEALVGHP